MSSKATESLELDDLQPHSGYTGPGPSSRIPVSIPRMSGINRNAGMAQHLVLGDKTNTFDNNIDSNIITKGGQHDNTMVTSSKLPTMTGGTTTNPLSRSTSRSTNAKAKSMLDLASDYQKRVVGGASTAAKTSSSRSATNSAISRFGPGFAGPSGIKTPGSGSAMGLTWSNQSPNDPVTASLHEENHTLKLKNQELQANIDRLRTNASQWDLEKQKMSDQNSELLSKLDTIDMVHQEQLDAINTDKQALEQHYQNQMKQIHDQYLSKMREIQLLHDNEKSNITNEIKTQAESYYEPQLKDKDAVINNLKISYNAEQTRLQQEIHAYRRSEELLKQQLQTLSQELASLQASASSLESASASKQDRISELETELQLQTQQVHSMKIQLQAAVDDRDNCKQKLLKEETLRRKLHNQVQELKGNIRVYCRARPPLPFEDSAEVVELKFPDEDLEGQQMLIAGPSAESATGAPITKTYSYQFDKIFGPKVSNREIFEEISQLVQSALDGYNVCIFAYGQTGSGKTYTMSSSEDGMIPLAVNQIFSTAEALKEIGWNYDIEGQFLEIYNESLRDLLNPTGTKNNGSSIPPHSPGGTMSSNSGGKLDIRHDPKTQKTTVVGLTTVALDSIQAVTEVLKKASENRFVASTKANERSSRSHSVFMLRIRGENHKTGKTCDSMLNLIDLAGSERLSHSQATGDRMKETQAINKSLSCLGDVIYALGSSKEGSHIPYRNSKLTYLLQNSLSGDSKTLMFVNISPMEAHMNETVSSLRFATKVNSTSLKKK